MTDSICPNCGASVESTARACPYCGAALTPAPSASAPTLRASREELESALREAQPASQAYNSSAEAMDAIKAELRAGRKPQAAEIYRDYFKVDQAAAQAALEQIEFELKPTAPSRKSDTEIPAFARPEAAPVAAAASIPATPATPATPVTPTERPTWLKWVIGCVAALLVLCLCSCLGLALLMAFSNGNFQ